MAKAPTKLTAKYSGEIKPKSWVTIETNEEIQIPEGFYGVIGIRKSLFAKQLVMGANCIHSGFDGYIGVQLHNAGDNVVEIRSGDEIANVFYSAEALTVLCKAEE